MVLILMLISSGVTSGKSYQVHSTENNGSTLANEQEEMAESSALEIYLGEYFSQEDILSYVGGKELLSLTEGVLPLDQVISVEQYGTHELLVVYIDQGGERKEQVVSVIVSGKPEIRVTDPVVQEGKPFSLASLGVHAWDYEDGDLSAQVLIQQAPFEDDEVIHFKSGEQFEVVLSVEDQEGHVTIENVEVRVEESKTASFSSEPNTIVPSQNITLSGKTRYGTAAEISKSMYAKSDVAILVSGVTFPDALTTGPLAMKLQAPILLSNKEDIHMDTLNELKRLEVKKIYIMGGPVAISHEVEKVLVDIGYEIERIEGNTRYTTSLAVANVLGESDTVVMVNGKQFPDAMVAGSLASKEGYPILLIEEDKVPSETLTYVETHFKNVILMGGTSVIKEEVATKLTALGKTVTRVGGTSRFMTSVEMGKTYFSGAETAVIANGLSFADALAAVPYAATLNAPILLAGHDDVHDGVLTYLKNSLLENFHYIGGPLAISNNVKDQMENSFLIPIKYRTRAVNGNWTNFTQDAKTSGSTTQGRLSEIELALETTEKLSLRYSVSVDGKGWQSIKSSGAIGVPEAFIQGLLMELEGQDASSYNLSYRVFLEGSGWTPWVLGGEVAGNSNGPAILAMEAKVIRGNAFANKGTAFPAKPMEGTLAFTTARLNFRNGPSLNADVLVQTALNANLEIIRKHTMGSGDVWAEANYRVNGEVLRGYAHMNNIREERHVSKALITLNGLKNGDSLPEKSTLITGDVYHIKGVKDVRYYVNGVAMGSVPFGYLTTSSLRHGFSTPQETGYRISIPAHVWNKGAINSLKIEILANDGSKEWEAVYLNDSKDELIFEQYAGSYNYYLNREFKNNKPSYYDGGVRRFATLQELDTYFDPSKWIASDLYKYVYADLRYNPEDFEVTKEQLNKEINKNNYSGNILVGMGEHFLKGAIDNHINPFYLVSHAILETGWGRSVLANGQKMTEAYNFDKKVIEPVPDELQEVLWYNVYGIGAYSRDAEFYGGSMAYQRGWDTVEKAIEDGAKWVANGYINRNPEPQNTNFKMRFNLHENMTHQYAEDARWGHHQAGRIKNLFDSLGEDVTVRFIVPLFGQIRS